MNVDFVLPVVLLPEVPEVRQRDFLGQDEVDHVDEDLVGDEVALTDASLVFVVDGREDDANLGGVELDARLDDGGLQGAQTELAGLFGDLQVFEGGELDGHVLNKKGTCSGSSSRFTSSTSNCMSNLWMVTKASA